MKTILITGGTSGFGKAIAEKFSSAGWNCIITSRHEDALQEVKSDLIKKYNNKVLTLKFDVSKENEVSGAIKSIPAEFKKIDILVNNVGCGVGLNTFENMTIEDIDSMIDTNIKGALYTTHKILPDMISKKHGHIINIGSIGAKIVGRGWNLYSLTKFAIDAFSKGLRVDLMKYKIKVTAIHPGKAKTNFFLSACGGNKEKLDDMYKEFKPLYPEDIADAVYFVANLNDNVCIDELIINAISQTGDYTEKDSEL